MSRILVVDQERRPLMPTTPARARILLKSRQAAILRRFPLVLILKDTLPEAVVEPLRVKLDPGSKTSGIAVVNERTGEVLWAAELTHRSQQIHSALLKRAAARKGSARRGRAVPCPAAGATGTPNDAPRALSAVDRLLLLAPDNLRGLRDRAELCEELGGASAAASALEKVLDLEPLAVDAAELRGRVRRLRGTARLLN